MSDFFEEQFGKVNVGDEIGQATLAVASAKRTGGSANPKSGKSSDEGQLTVDVYQNEYDIMITSAIAGVTSEDIDISITNEMVTIRGKRQPDESISEDDYYYQELYWGPFSRSIILPEDIDVEKASASMKNGVLTLRLPKLAKSRMKKVKISS